MHAEQANGRSKKEMRLQCCSYTVGTRDARCSCAFLFDRRTINDSARAKHRKPAMKYSDVLQSYSPEGLSIDCEQKSRYNAAAAADGPLIYAAAVTDSNANKLLPGSECSSVRQEAPLHGVLSDHLHPAAQQHCVAELCISRCSAVAP